MSEGYVKVDASNLKEMLARFGEVTGKSMPQLVRAHARIACVELANRTQPFTGGGKNGKEVLERGTKYLRKDLLKVTKDRASLEEKANNIHDAGLQKYLRAAIISGDQLNIAGALVKVGTIKSIIDFRPVSGPSEMGEIHKNRRSRRTGHALSTRPIYHYAAKGIDGYVKTIAKRLGYAKSGWAECARKIGGIKGDGARGIPAFAKRHKGNNAEVDDKTTSKANPHFTMTNTTFWTSKLLSERKQQEALNIAREKMIKAMNKVFRYVAKNGKDVESITAATVANAE